MPPYVVTFLFSSVVMSLIAVVLLTFCHLFPKAFPAKIRYVIWLVIMIGLVFPFRPVISEGFIAVPISVTEPSAYDGLTEIPARLPVEMGPNSSPLRLCVFLWAIPGILIFAYHFRRYVQFKRAIKRWGATVTENQILSVLRAVQAENGVSHKIIALKVCGFVSSSMLTGFLRPVILLPDKCFEADELALIFRHEIIHYKRHDLPVKLLSVVALSIHWFNPVVYWLCSALQTDCEASCDEAVVQGSDSENRRFYAEIIMGMIDGKKRLGTRLSTCFYGGKAGMKKRLDSIMNVTDKIKSPAIFTVIAVVALTALSGSVFALAVREPPAPILPPASSPTTNPNPTPGPSPTPGPAVGTGPIITAEKAKEIALAYIGGGIVTQCKLDNENGRQFYEIKILSGNTEYEMDIDAINGTVSDYEEETTVISGHNSGGGHRDGHGHDD